jgi:uncharacterized protein
MATLMIGVTTQGETAAEALAANSARRYRGGDRPPDRQRDRGAGHADLEPVDQPELDGYDSSTKSTISGYVATNLLTVRVRDLDTTGDGPGCGGGGRGQHAERPDLRSRRARAGPERARKEAVADARAKAELLVTAAGMKLGRIVMITESGAWTDPQPMFRESTASAPPVAGGELAMTANVTVQYEMTE